MPGQKVGQQGRPGMRQEAQHPSAAVVQPAGKAGCNSAGGEKRENTQRPVAARHTSSALPQSKSHWLQAGSVPGVRKLVTFEPPGATRPQETAASLTLSNRRVMLACRSSLTVSVGSGDPSAIWIDLGSAPTRNGLVGFPSIVP